MKGLIDGLLGSVVTQREKTFKLLDLATQLMSAAGPLASSYVSAILVVILVATVLVAPVICQGEGKRVGCAYLRVCVPKGVRT